jgi:serine/threonine-protein kinase
MGSVWVAEHLTLKNDVALKFMEASGAKNTTALARFEQEAKAAATIKSPHIVQVLDFGQDAEGRPYMAMELLRGEELGRRLERVGRLELDEVKVIVAETCKALTKAHAAGFIHRDLKPENIFLCAEDDGFSVKILDFGLAKAQDGSLQMTGAGELVGTPHFMSPEQARGKPVDHRTDIYSLGVVTYQCLTGRLPFGDKQALPDLLVAITQKEPPLASVHRADLPAGVVTWLFRCLQKDPAARFSSAKEMAETFVNACEVRRMVVSVPKIGGTDDEPSAHGEDITMRAGQAAVDVALAAQQHAPTSEAPPTAVPSTTPDAAPPVSQGSAPLERAPIAFSSPPPEAAPGGAGIASERPTQPSGDGYAVDRTLPMGASSDAFAAARAPMPDAPPPSIRAALPEPQPVRPLASRGVSPFYLALVLILIAAGAAVYVASRGAGPSLGPGSAHSGR